VLERLNAFVATHPGLSLSSASNQLIDEALRMQEHPLIVFWDGPAGRRARLVAGPDVWEIVGAVRSAREAEPELAGNEVIDLVAETSGLEVAEIRAALEYWGDYPEEVEAFLEHARAEVDQARIRWEREHDLLGR
jgi:glycosyltransferase involved in cell wall biosynthesis